MRSMRRVVLAVAAAGAMVGTATADDINVGIVLGYTGPIESLTPDMAASAELALQEASDSGAFLGGRMLKPVRGDSTCIDAAAATAAAERLVNSDSVAAIMGADCSGVTTAVANNVAVPNGVVLISPSATSPALTTIKDNGYFFRTAPSDARQGEVLAQVLMNRKVTNVAVTFTNNDYGRGSPTASRPPSKRWAARSRRSCRMRTERRTIRPRSPRSRRPGPTISRCSVMSTRAARASSGTPSTPARSANSSWRTA